LFVYRQVLEIAGHLTSSQPCVSSSSRSSSLRSIRQQIGDLP